MGRSKLFTMHIALLALLCFGINGFAYADSMAAERHMARGVAAVEIAKTLADYLDAVKEFSEAVKLEPDWADAWFNLGTAQESAEKYQEAIRSFKTYLEKSPDASDRKAVKTRIFGLEYKMEKTNSPETIEKQRRMEAQKFIKKLEGARFAQTKKLPGLGTAQFVLDIQKGKIVEGRIWIHIPASTKKHNPQMQEGVYVYSASWPLSDRNFSKEKGSWCNGGFNCPARGSISESGDSIIIRYKDFDKVGEQTNTYTRIR